MGTFGTVDELWPGTLRHRWNKCETTECRLYINVYIGGTNDGVHSWEIFNTALY